MLALLVASGIGLLWPLLLIVTEDSQSEPVTDTAVIEDYAATYRLGEDGRLAVSETVSVDFPDAKHGIYRFWSVADPVESGVRLTPEVSAIMFDGESVPVEYSWERGEQVRVAKIGAPTSEVAHRQ